MPRAVSSIAAAPSGEATPRSSTRGARLLKTGMNSSARGRAADSETGASAGVSLDALPSTPIECRLLTRLRIREASSAASSQKTRAQSLTRRRTAGAPSTEALDFEEELSPGRPRDGAAPAPSTSLLSRRRRASAAAVGRLSAVAAAASAVLERETEKGTAKPSATGAASSETASASRPSASAAIAVEATPEARVCAEESSTDFYLAALEALKPSAGTYCGCRDEYEKEVFSFVNKQALAKRGGLLYLCGASGVGKTCVAEDALRRSLALPRVRAVCHPQLLALSCAHRERDAQVMQELLVRMLGRSADGRLIQRELREQLQLHGIQGAVQKFTAYSQKSPKLWLCLLDEVDFLCTRGKTRQDMRLTSGSGVGSQGSAHDALLAIALAATHPQSKLIAVAISNSIELSTHLAGLTVRTLAVAPYTEKEILAIIQKKLQVATEALNEARRKRGLPALPAGALEKKVFAPSALLIFARKAANSNGDLRMALSGLSRVIQEKLTEINAAASAPPSQTPAAPLVSNPRAEFKKGGSLKRRATTAFTSDCMFDRTCLEAGSSLEAAPPSFFSPKTRREDEDAAQDFLPPSLVRAAGGAEEDSPPSVSDSEAAQPTADGWWRSTKAPRLHDSGAGAEGGGCGILKRRPPPRLTCLLQPDSLCNQASSVASLTRTSSRAASRRLSQGGGEATSAPSAALEGDGAALGTPQSTCSTAPSPGAATPHQRESSASVGLERKEASLEGAVEGGGVKTQTQTTAAAGEDDAKALLSLAASAAEKAALGACAEAEGLLRSKRGGRASVVSNDAASESTCATASSPSPAGPLACGLPKDIPEALLLRSHLPKDFPSVSHSQARRRSSARSSSSTCSLTAMQNLHFVQNPSASLGSSSSSSVSPSPTSAAGSFAAAGVASSATRPSGGVRPLAMAVASPASCVSLGRAAAAAAVGTLGEGGLGLSPFSNNAAEDTAPARASSEAIGVGVMSVKAGALYGGDQQQIVGKIEGLPMMQRVYLLAACRSAQQKLHALEQSRRRAASFRDSSQTSSCTSGGRLSQQPGLQGENQLPSSRPGPDACGVPICLEDVEAQYKLLAAELPHGHLLSGKLTSSCWRHAVECFEGNGLIVPATQHSQQSASSSHGGAVGGGSFGLHGGRLVRRARSSVGMASSFSASGMGARKSLGGCLYSAAQSKAQAWELQLSPALIEAAIRRLQPQLMESDLESHFSRGLEA